MIAKHPLGCRATDDPPCKTCSLCAKRGSDSSDEGARSVGLYRYVDQNRDSDDKARDDEAYEVTGAEMTLGG